MDASIISAENVSLINCTNVPVQQGNIATLTREVTSIMCLVLCSLALLLQGYRLRKRSNTLLRLFLYLTISSVLYLLTGSLHLQHYFHFQGQETVCVVIGVLDQYTSSVQILLTLGITVVLFHKLFSLSETYKRFISKCKLKNHPSWLRQGYCFEVLLCLISILLPLTVLWVPFLSKEGSRYGLVGPWCWIQKNDPITCEETTSSILERVLLWYAPFGLVALVCLLCITCILVFLCYLRFNHGFLEKQT